MPISDPPDYEPGHFSIVYEYLIKPACRSAQFEPLRADEVHKSNFIVLDIIRHLVESEMVVCDLSSRNPNVMYELGIRQAFNKPVAIVRDDKTSRIFDIQGLRDLEYDHMLRVDRTEETRAKLSEFMANTYAAPLAEVNSFVQLLGVNAARPPEPSQISGETSLILNSLQSLGERITSLESGLTVASPSDSSPHETRFGLLEPWMRHVRTLLEQRPTPMFATGERVIHQSYGVGWVKAQEEDLVTVLFPRRGTKRILAQYLLKYIPTKERAADDEVAATEPNT